jgi:hypothetical protein
MDDDDDLWWLWIELRRERLMARRAAALYLLPTLMTRTEDAWLRCAQMQERACTLIDYVASHKLTYQAATQAAVASSVSAFVSVGNETTYRPLDSSMPA